MFTFGFNVKPRKAGGVSYDADAQAFFTAASITDTTQKNAVNQLVLDLKSYNIWTKMKAVYPIVGGTAATHKFNLVNPQDTNAAFRLAFSTGWTHSSSGITPNGSSAYANTYLNPNTILNNSNNHLSVYSRTNSGGNMVELGSYGVSGLTYYFLTYLKGAANTFVLADGNSVFPSVANADSKGFYIMSKPSASNASGYKNGTKVINNQNVGTGVSFQNVFMGACNTDGTVGLYSNKEIAFGSLGDSLTDTEAANFNTAVQAYQTTLSRNV